MNNLQHICSQFEEHTITTLTYQGRPVWIAREIGVVCGYAQGGKRLATLITTEWADEYIEGIDYLLVTGSELAGLTDLLSKGTQHVPFENRRGLLLLLEPGLYLALVKTRKPIGKRLRRFLVEHVLPQLARDGRYLPERTVQPLPVEIPQLLQIPDGSQAVSVEGRLEQAADVCSLLAEQDRKGALSPEVQTAYQVLAAELVMGTSLAALMPVVEDVWLSPTDIASMCNVSVQRIGLTITALGLRGKEGLSRKILNKAKGHARTVESFLYNPAAVEVIEQALNHTTGPAQAKVESPSSQPSDVSEGGA